MFIVIVRLVFTFTLNIPWGLTRRTTYGIRLTDNNL